MSLLSFGLNRLATTSTDLSPVVLALVDGSGILTLMLLRLWRTNSPLKERPLWKAIHRVSGDLAVFGLILCILGRGPTALLAPSAAGCSSSAAARRRDLAATAGAGCAAVLAEPVLLVGTPTTGWPCKRQTCASGIAAAVIQNTPSHTTQPCWAGCRPSTPWSAGSRSRWQHL